MSYSKQTWETGDTVTADKLNHMEDGIQTADNKGIPDVYYDGEILFSVGGDGGPGYWTQVDARSLSSYLSTQVIALTFDDQTGAFHVDRESSMNLQKYAKTTNTCIALYNMGYVFGATLQLSNPYYGPLSYVTSIIPLDDLGLTGYVGFLQVLIDREGDPSGDSVELYKWQATTGVMP